MQRRQLQRQRDAQAQRRHLHVLERRRRSGLGRVGDRRDLQRQHAALHGGGDADRAAALRVPRDVVDEMLHRLGDALGVAAQPRQAAQAGREQQRHVLGLQRRRQPVGQPLKNVGQIERRLLQRGALAGQPRQVRQLVGDAHQVAHLALHDAARAQPAVRVVVGQPQQLDAVGQRRQRIAQVVREAGQEGVTLAMRQLRVVDCRVPFGAHRHQRRLGVGQRGLDALQFIVGAGHP